MIIQFESMSLAYYHCVMCIFYNKKLEKNRKRERIKENIDLKSYSEIDISWLVSG